MEEPPFLCFVAKGTGLCFHPTESRFEPPTSPVTTGAPSPDLSLEVPFYRIGSPQPDHGVQISSLERPPDCRFDHSELIDIERRIPGPKVPAAAVDVNSDTHPLSLICAERSTADSWYPITPVREDEDTWDPFITPCLKERSMLSTGRNVAQQYYGMSPITPFVPGTSVIPADTTATMSPMGFSATLSPPCFQVYGDFPRTAPCSPAGGFNGYRSSDVDGERPLPLLAWTPAAVDTPSSDGSFAVSPTVEEMKETTGLPQDDRSFPPLSASAPCSPTHKKRTWRSVLCRMLRAGS
eukprot:Rmarinus@m.28174